MEDNIKQGEGILAFISRNNTAATTLKTGLTKKDLDDILNIPEQPKNRPILGQIGAKALLSMDDKTFAVFYNSNIEILTSLDGAKAIEKRAKKLGLL